MHTRLRMTDTPINNKGRHGGNDDFHAGRFLRETLDGSGHDMAWLALRTGMTPAELEALLAQPNMDAELFVRTGMPMDPLFMRRVEEMVFGKTEMVN